jgi:hypothetical protein
MKRFLFVSAITLSLVFDANAQWQAVTPDFWGCFDLLRLEGLQIEGDHLLMARVASVKSMGGAHS